MSGDNFAAQSYDAYRRILAAVPEKFKTETGLGGMLFFAGRLTERALPLLVAANISGCGSLVVAENAERGKEALRDGVVDFLVSSLDEALRILKNEIRKKQPTSVALTASYAEVMAEMIERGVQPDLVDLELEGVGEFLELGARTLPESGAIPKQALIFAHGTAPELARVDAFWREMFLAENLVSERWQRLSARYLGRLAQGLRVYGYVPEFADEKVAALKEYIQKESLDVTVELSR